MNPINPKNIIYLADSYKDLHSDMLPEGTQNVSSYCEARTGSMYPSTVFFGLQYFLKEYLCGPVVTHKLIDEASPILKEHFKFNGDVWNADKWRYIANVHGGRLPLEIKAVAEGTKVPVSNALFRTEATDDNCGWLTNYVETVLLNTWYPTTVCTRANLIVEDIKKSLRQTGDDSIQWLGDYLLHDFGARGCTCPEQAGLGGLAVLVNTRGTDTKMSIPFAINYYGAQMDGLCYSVPASEHSIMTSEGEEGEENVIRRLCKKYPNGILSVVSDSYGIEKLMAKYTSVLKNDILSRNGKFVIRPDSPRYQGDTPAKQVLWIAQTLWHNFGGNVNSKGYKVLDSHVGIIYGDSLTREQIQECLNSLKADGFSTECCVYGCGGYLLQKLNRDTQRFKIASSAQMRNGVWHDVCKNPSDTSKASKRGRVGLYKDDLGAFYTSAENSALGENYLKTVFRNGELLIDYNFNEIRKRAGLIV